MIADIERQLIDLERDTQNANTVKDMVIAQLLKDGHIADTVASEYSIYWNIILTKYSWFTKLFKEKNIKDSWAYNYIKL